MKYIQITLIALSFFSCVEQKTEHFDHLITNVNIVDVNTETIIANQNVGIRNGLIVSIYSDTKNVSDSTVIVNGTGKYLIPGLWDMHVHSIGNVSTLNILYLRYGVTGVRDMWGALTDMYSGVSDEIPLVVETQPTMFKSYSMLDGENPTHEGAKVITTADQAKTAVAEHLDKKTDFVKIYSKLSREAYYAIAYECRKNNIPFAGHVPNAITIWEAIEAGQTSSEHLYQVMEACLKNPDSLPELQDPEFERWGDKRYKIVFDNYDKSKEDSLFKTIAKSKLAITPTLLINKVYMDYDSTLSRKEMHPLLEKWLIDIWDERRNKFSDTKLSKKMFEYQLSLMGSMQKAGVLLLAGTDALEVEMIPGISLHDELALFVKGGLTNGEALKTATINPAIYMGNSDKYGSAEIGKIASLVILEKNPLEDIRNTTSVVSVFSKGTYYNNNALLELEEFVKSTVFSSMNDN